MGNCVRKSVEEVGYEKPTRVLVMNDDGMARAKRWLGTDSLDCCPTTIDNDTYWVPQLIIMRGLLAIQEWIKTFEDYYVMTIHI